MWRSSGVFYLPYIFRTLKRVYKPTAVISTKLLKMTSFCPNVACGYRERAERHLCVENGYCYQTIHRAEKASKGLYNTTSPANTGIDIQAVWFYCWVSIVEVVVVVVVVVVVLLIFYCL